MILKYQDYRQLYFFLLLLHFVKTQIFFSDSCRLIIAAGQTSSLWLYWGNDAPPDNDIMCRTLSLPQRQLSRFSLSPLLLFLGKLTPWGKTEHAAPTKVSSNREPFSPGGQRDRQEVQPVRLTHLNKVLVKLRKVMRLKIKAERRCDTVLGCYVFFTHEETMKEDVIVK